MTTALSIANISKSYGFHQILSQVSFIVNDGERVGLVGANGVGKSTLLKIIMQEIEPDSGSIAFRQGARLGYLEQVMSHVEDKTIDDLITESMQHIYALEAQMRELEQHMTTASGDALDVVMGEYGEISEQFERYGGYEIEHQVDTVLEGLRVGHLPRSRVFETLSGGEKSRVGLALLLLQSPDVLLLDEPTNHLDFVSLEWLEGYLKSYRGAVLIVSHDRHFLNQTVHAIIELDEHSRTAKRYTGDYDAYHAAKALERRKWIADFVEQQEEIKALRIEIKVTARRNDNDRKSIRTDGDKFLRNFKKAGHEETVSKRVRSSEEKLSRIEENPIPKPPEDLRFDAEFNPQELKGKLPLIVSDLTKSFGDRCILDHVSFALDLGGRVCIVGPNGAGKSTLLKILMQQETADEGEVRFSPAARIGYLDQEQDALLPEMTLFEAYRAGLEEPDQNLKALLFAAGLFRYDDLEKQVENLSAGQRRKVQIARLIAGKSNFLVLDEPTNYVSFDVLEGLEDALKLFPGPVIAASHDRRFMQQFGGQIWELRDGQLIKYLGGYEEYITAQSTTPVGSL